jgi:hypothetical protein
LGKSYGNFSVAFFTIGGNPILKKLKENRIVYFPTAGFLYCGTGFASFTTYFLFVALQKNLNKKHISHQYKNRLMLA